MGIGYVYAVTVSQYFFVFFVFDFRQKWCCACAELEEYT